MSVMRIIGKPLLIHRRVSGLTYLFITHDMSVVKHISDDIAVMYLGQVVEKAPSRELFRRQFHPYTRALISAIPTLKPGAGRNQIILKGEIGSPVRPSSGLPLRPALPARAEGLHGGGIPPREIEPRRFVACLRAEELAD